MDSDIEARQKDLKLAMLFCTSQKKYVNILQPNGNYIYRHFNNQ
jgi:hypothetical protein